MIFGLGKIFDEITPIAKDVFSSFVAKGETDNLTWLTQTFANNEHTASEADSLANEVFSTVKNFNTNLRSIEQAARKRKTKEQWLKEFIENSDLTEQQKSEYLATANKALELGTRVMLSDTPMSANIVQEVNQLMEKDLSVENISLNRYERVPVAEQLGHQAALIGVNSMMIPDELANEQGEEILQQDLTEEPLGSKLDEGIKMAASAVLKIGHAAGKIPFLPKETPVKVITNVACVGVETFKNIGRVVTGKISTLQAIENVGRSAVAAIADICTTGLPAKVLAPIPVVGPALSIAVGGILTQCSPKVVQKKIHAGIKKVKEVASNVVTTIKNIKNGINKAFEEAKEIGSKVLNFVFSLF